MRKWINSYFNFTKAEFNGILTLFVLITLCLALPRIYIWLRPDEPSKADIKEISDLNLQSKFKELPGQRIHYSATPAAREPKLHTFDPNTLDQQGWQDFGLSVKQARAIINYRQKGGRFRKPEDLQKMYTIRPELYQELKHYVKITDTSKQQRFRDHPATPTASAKRSIIVYELNGLDTMGMQAINGIGPAFARRIFKYRERLGGFVHPEQLLEVFGIDSSHYERIRPQIRIDEGQVRKININTADFETLRQHPYLRYKQVNAIIEYRKQHGNYSSFADLKKVAILSAETVDKLVPYFSF
jgi:competence protein ComEA